MTLPRDWPPYLSPPWLAVCAAGLGAWIALYGLGGWTVVTVVAAIASYAIARCLWCLHTLGDREARATVRRWREDARGGADES